MYELAWQVASPDPGPDVGLTPSPAFAISAASKPVAATLAIMQLLQSHAVVAGTPAFSFSRRCAASDHPAHHTSAAQVSNMHDPYKCFWGQKCCLDSVRTAARPMLLSALPWHEPDALLRMQEAVWGVVRAAIQETPTLDCSGFQADSLLPAARKTSPLCVSVSVSSRMHDQPRSAGYPMRSVGGACSVPRLLASADAAAQRCGPGQALPHLSARARVAQPCLQVVEVQS